MITLRDISEQSNTTTDTATPNSQSVQSWVSLVLQLNNILFHFRQHHWELVLQSWKWDSLGGFFRERKRRGDKGCVCALKGGDRQNPLILNLNNQL